MGHAEGGVCVKDRKGLPLLHRAWRDLSECLHVSSAYFLTSASRANSLTRPTFTPPQYTLGSPGVSDRYLSLKKRSSLKSLEQGLSVLYFHNFIVKESLESVSIVFAA